MKRFLLLTVLLPTLLACGKAPQPRTYALTPDILPGATALEEYLPLLEGQRVSILSNQTGMVTSERHVLDTLLSLGVNVVSIFSPEHGFRGTADAGELVSSSVDEPTGVPIRSLYDGKGGVPSEEAMSEFDVLLFDLQDVGCRFYTYNVTMGKMMAVCATHGKKMIVLDRPNPIGFYVDGPILDMKYKSGVGWYPIPVCHGMTLGELALMINGEGWLQGGLKCNLTVVPMQGYRRDSIGYELPVPPSPNLRNAHAIALYPSLCLFEGTNVSVGRGTDSPFEIIGIPSKYSTWWCSNTNFTLAGNQIAGAFYFAPQGGEQHFGINLWGIDVPARFDLSYLMVMYSLAKKDCFFLKSNFFEKLAGNGDLRKQIEQGMSEEEIRATWQPALDKFKEIRKKYLIYED